MVDYEFYVGTYGGSKVNDSAQFTLLEDRAETMVDYFTFGRSRKTDDEDLIELIKKTICELIDIYNDYENVGGGLIKSSSEGKESVTFRDIDSRAINLELYSVVRRRLSTSGLMDRGV